MVSHRHANWLLHSKLAAPPPPGDTVQRAALLDTLFAVKHIRVTMVSAPAGYGKTTLLSQIHARQVSCGLRSAWLTLDSFDRDPRQLLAYIAASLRRAGLAINEISELATGEVSDKSIHFFTGMIFNAIMDEDARYCLILDDYHEIEDRKTNEFLDYFLKAAPQNLTFIIASRVRPTLTLSRFFVRGELRELSTKDLRFSVAEATEYFGSRLPGHEISALVERLEGWPAALRLFELSREATAHPSGFTDDFTGSSTECADYLSEQILLSVPPEMQDFILTSAVPERLSGDLMNELTGRDDSWAQLEELQRRNLLISAIGSEQQWFRYHKLFKDFLYGRLYKAKPEAVTALHLKAAAWFEKKGALRDAVFHAKQSGNAQMALDILERAGGWRVAICGESSVFAQMTDLPVAICESYTQVRLGQIYIMMQTGEVAAARDAFDGLQRRLSWKAATNITGNTAAVMDLIEYVLGVYEDRDFTMAEIESLEERLGPLATHDDLVQILLGILICYTSYLTGDYERALHTGQRLHPKIKHDSVTYLRNYVHIYMGMCCFALGRLAHAKHYYDTIINGASSRSINFAGQRAAAQILLAEVLTEEGDADTAAALLWGALPVLEHFAGWYDLFEAAYDTLAAIARRTNTQAKTRAYLDAKDSGRTIVGRDRVHTMLGMLRANEFLHTGCLTEVAALLQRPDIAALSNVCADHAEADIRLRARALTLVIRFKIMRQQWADAAAAHVALARITASSQRRKYARTNQLLAAALAFGDGKGEAGLDLLGKAKDLAAAYGLWGSLADEADVVRHSLHTGAALPAAIIRKAGDILGSEHWNPIHDAGPNPAFDAPPTPQPVTDREQEIIRLLFNGYTSKEIAHFLGMSVNTVFWHRKNLYRKFEVSTRSQLMRKIKADTLAASPSAVSS